MDTVLLNGELAFVGASGELFSDLSNRIKARSGAGNTLVFGYCNGHSMYIPTREGVDEGGYGADPLVAWCPVGTGEAIVEKAVENITTLLAQ
jgi:neutral ceramidase